VSRSRRLERTARSRARLLAWLARARDTPDLGETCSTTRCGADGHAPHRPRTRLSLRHPATRDRPRQRRGRALRRVPARARLCPHGYRGRTAVVGLGRRPRRLDPHVDRAEGGPRRPLRHGTLWSVAMTTSVDAWVVADPTVCATCGREAYEEDHMPPNPETVPPPSEQASAPKPRATESHTTDWVRDTRKRIVSSNLKNIRRALALLNIQPTNDAFARELRVNGTTVLDDIFSNESGRASLTNTAG